MNLTQLQQTWMTWTSQNGSDTHDNCSQMSNTEIIKKSLYIIKCIRNVSKSCPPYKDRTWTYILNNKQLSRVINKPLTLISFEDLKVVSVFTDIRYFEEITKTDGNSSKSGKILKIMGPHESLSEDLSNKYQCYRVSITSKIFIFFLILATEVDIRPKWVNIL
jgi:hypothetical protein